MTEPTPQKLSDNLKLKEVTTGEGPPSGCTPDGTRSDITEPGETRPADGKVVLVDFGAANEFISTATGTFVGKHSFISPEQLRGKATTQSDIYAFGCTLYFLLVGHEPD
ncbi:MAG: hypothetical protein KGS72_13860, partial [Cyanobacteria bacterium REEB67]|nr:hypothetical protein [Cyanobacteria bacterium REEB67]